MRTKLYSLLLALPLLAGTTATAQNQQVVVNLKDGQAQTILMDEMGYFTFSPQGSVVAKTKKSSLTWLIDNVQSIKFQNLITGIGAIRTESSQLTLRHSNHQLTAEGLDGTANAAVYTVNGQQVMSLNVWNGQAVSTEQLAKGVYVLRVGNQSIKFVR